MAPTVERVTPPCRIGEGPVWDETNQKLYYVDIYGHTICRLDPATGKVTTARMGQGYVSVVVQVQGCPDKLLVGLNRDVILVTWNGENDTEITEWETLAQVDTERKDTRLNDGKCDPAGRFWFGTMANEVDGFIKPHEGTFFRCEHDLSVKRVLAPVSISNGLAWNKDKDTMYYIDSPTNQVYGYDYNNSTGQIKNQRVVFDLEKNNVVGLPDGMTTDSDDNLWVALFGGGAVIQINPRTGTLMQTVKMPADNITSVAFGGPNYDVLYVTSALHGVTGEQQQKKPDSGCCFAVKNLGVKGLPPTKFRMDKPSQ